LLRCRLFNARGQIYDEFMGALLELRNLTVELPTPGGWVRPVNDVSLELATGGSLGLVGESGSGKTMLALAMMGLLPPGACVSGSATLRGTNGDAIELTRVSEQQWTRLRGRRIGMVFQEPMTALNPVMRVGAQVGEAIQAHEPNVRSSELQRRVIEALQLAAVPEPEARARQYPHELSGGLRQRVLIAMAVAGGQDFAAGNGAASVKNAAARVLIADEPTTALDVTVQKQILELLARLRRELGLALIFITHDLGVVAQVAEEIAVLYAGRVVERGPALQVLARPKHPYTEGLLRASPQLTRTKLEAICGMVPSLDAMPPGCAFAPRCPRVIDDCAKAVPELREVAEQQWARCIRA
jgi:oligopeptide/dipeptide ABC transporter ATP-binding protein